MGGPGQEAWGHNLPSISCGGEGGGAGRPPGEVMRGVRMPAAWPARSGAGVQKKRIFFVCGAQEGAIGREPALPLCAAENTAQGPRSTGTGRGLLTVPNVRVSRLSPSLSWRFQ